MAILIDGYNLMHAAGIVGRGFGPRGLERSRNALLNFVAASVPVEELPRTTVVFDAENAPPGLPRTVMHEGITVRYASDYDGADSMIEELILADSAPRQLVVVSSDHRLHRAARRRRAKAIDSDVWYAEMIARRRMRDTSEPPSAKPRGGGAADVEFWQRKIREEGLDDDALGEPGNPFPPGYGDDVFGE